MGSCNASSPMTNVTRPPLESLACINAECSLYAQAGQNNLKIRKTYSSDQIRYLRCRKCGTEFSERKNTALWNCKIPEERAIRVSDQLAEGTSIKGTARLSQTHTDTVRRLALKSGQHAQAFHDTQAHQLDIRTLEMDERHGYVERKEQPLWDAVTIDPQSKFIVQLALGERDEQLIEQLMCQSAKRLLNPQDILLMTDGAVSYKSLFPEVFGIPYFPPVKVALDGFPTDAIAFLAPWPM